MFLETRTRKKKKSSQISGDGDGVRIVYKCQGLIARFIHKYISFHSNNIRNTFVFAEWDRHLCNVCVLETEPIHRCLDKNQLPFYRAISTIASAYCKAFFFKSPFEIHFFTLIYMAYFFHTMLCFGCVKLKDEMAKIHLRMDSFYSDSMTSWRSLIPDFWHSALLYKTAIL